MSATAATAQSFRVVSRKAQFLLDKHLASKRPPGGTTTKSGGSAEKSAETPWPKSLRYTFYVACAAAVPFSIGSMIAMSPRLRDSLSDETDPEEDGMTSNNLIHLVRKYWGNYEYIPPTDRAQADNVVPGHKFEYQQDNWTSLLAFLGLYTPREGEVVKFDPNEGVPISLDNELPSNLRHQQILLARYLSPEQNPSGVKVKLSFFPFVMFDDQVRSGHEIECTLPPNSPLSSLRHVISVANASDAVQKVNTLFPGANILQSDSQTIDWNGTYRCVLDFDSDEDLEGYSTSDTADNIDSMQALSLDSYGEKELSQNMSKMILHNTTSHSSWSYVPDVNAISNTSPSKFASSTDSTASPQRKDPDSNSLRIEQLKHQISMLQKELNDPSSLRDRDDMYAELKAANQELNSIKPGWWRRLLG